jgi:predicted nucleic acid-binding protein
MLVASNTSPVCNLAIIGRLDLLRIQFGQILIPMAVRNELEQLSHGDAVQAIQRGLGEEWIKTQEVKNESIVRLLQTTLDRGEAEAIALALEISADLVLLDERDGRRVAERAGLRVSGVLGVLLRAKTDAQIPAIRPEIDALRARARFFVSSEVERKVLDLAGE